MDELIWWLLRKGEYVFDSLLESFKGIQSTHVIKDETIFDICGFPHYENVVSNVLAFFFDDEKKHNLNGLLTESFVEAAKITDQNLDLQFQVEREVKTNSGGYIDLLLHNDSCCIVIENKIFSPLNNDIQDYMEFARDRYNINAYGVILSIWNIDPNNNDYINVNYSKFFDILKSNLGHFLGVHNNQHLFLLIDLINNIEELQNGGPSMNPDFLSFIRKNKEDVLKFGTELKMYHDELRNIIKLVNSTVSEMLQEPSVKQTPWRRLPELCDYAVSEFQLENGARLAIDSRADPDKWEFKIYVIGEPGLGISIGDYCKNKGLLGKVIENRFLLNESLPIETDPTEVAQKIVFLIRKLKF